jgi:hypothetical protein
MRSGSNVTVFALRFWCSVGSDDAISDTLCLISQAFFARALAYVALGCCEISRAIIPGWATTRKQSKNWVVGREELGSERVFGYPQRLRAARERGRPRLIRADAFFQLGGPVSVSVRKRGIATSTSLMFDYSP